MAATVLFTHKTLLEVIFARFLIYSLLPMRVLEGYVWGAAVMNVFGRSRAAYAQHLNVPLVCAKRMNGLTK